MAETHTETGNSDQLVKHIVLFRFVSLGLLTSSAKSCFTSVTLFLCSVIAQFV